MKEMQFTVERGGPLLPFLLEHVKGSRNHVKSLLARGRRRGGPPSRCSMRTGASWSLTSPPAC